ncbi:MAG: PH domain-containing protein [Luteimonas sp.]
MSVVTAALGGALPMAIAGGALGIATRGPRGALVALIAALAVALFGGWLGHKRFRHTAWRLDDDGFALRRGRLFETETRVPGSRVQHLDLKRGPLQRRYRLATLVIHTAGTRHSEVTLSGLDVDAAERLRDRLARQTDDDDHD